MTEEQIALARRAVACTGWRWLPGMRALRDARYWQGVSDVRVLDALHDGGYSGFFPDVTDPATLGCLLALVREVRGDVTLGVIRQDLGIMRSKEAWFIIGEGGDDEKWAHTEAEALVAALEGAP